MLAACQAQNAPHGSAPPSTAVRPSIAASSDAASPGSAATTRPRPTQTPAPPADVALRVVADGLTAPVGLVAAPDGSGRSFVIDQTGLVLILRDGRLEERPFLDIRDRIVPLDPEYDERGLLGLAFHPGFPDDPRVFAYYGAPTRDGAAAGQDHTDTLVEYRVDPSDPDAVDAGSRRVVLEFDQPQPNHSGGGLGFGPDGFLYLGTGDGGGQGDASEGHSPQGNAQDPDKLNGKVLRLDVDGRQPFAIPADNPFAEGGGRPEIYALGFRNPWRLAWEPDGERRLLVSDVGYGRYEEIDVVERGGNYGWRIREGAHCLDIAQPLQETSGCDETGSGGEPLIDPVVEYSHDDVGIAVVGGYVYRGTALPALRGQYVFADFSADWVNTPTPRPTLLVASPSADAGAVWAWRRLATDAPLSRFISGMGEDADGELYLLTRGQLGPDGETGEVRQLVAPGG